MIHSTETPAQRKSRLAAAAELTRAAARRAGEELRACEKAAERVPEELADTAAQALQAARAKFLRASALATEAAAQRRAMRLSGSLRN